MKLLPIIIIFIGTMSCNISKQKISAKPEFRKSIEEQIAEIRLNDKFGFDSSKNARVYRLLNYPNPGFNNTINDLHFQLFIKKDLGGAYHKGISWFVIVENFKESEKHWKIIKNWSNSFKYDMTAHNEIYFLSKKIKLDLSKDRTGLIMSFFKNKIAQKNIIAMREINEDRNTFEKFPFR